jgi:hypothetical protein
MSSPFSIFVFRSSPTSVFYSRHADVDHCTPIHRAVPPPSTTLPNRRLLDLHPTPVHLCDPSSSSPNNPSCPSPPLLPARRVRPWTTRSSLSSIDLTTPRAPRHRVQPPRTVSCQPAPRMPPSTAVPLRPTTHRRGARSSGEDLPIPTPQKGAPRCRAALAPLLHQPLLPASRSRLGRRQRCRWLSTLPCLR